MELFSHFFVKKQKPTKPSSEPAAQPATTTQQSPNMLLNLHHSCHSFVPLNKRVCGQSVPEIVFHGSQEHGACSLVELLTSFPVPRFVSESLTKFEMRIRPRELFEEEKAENKNRIEIVEEIEREREREERIVLSQEFNDKQEVVGIYEDLLSRVGERERGSRVVVVRVHLFVPNSSFLNLVLIPLDLQSSLSQHIQEKSSQSLYCFVQDSNQSIKNASFKELFTAHIEQVRPILFLSSFSIN